ncbi:hypothetical protein CAC42_5455 [Sphaceloma murrayae]|uniref:PAS domain-containing protein n=1 Tax=Sphaceloma murrayae TaxID=2082308 RepID=A0A2K1QV26_9PEZI|nr:hypothetical protein CAC42_5455 [Sphaceloma murrayae]
MASFPQNLGPARVGDTLIPNAWLDLDLNIIKVNGPFSRIFGNFEHLLGMRLADISIPSTPDLFQTLRTRMRDERESKDPAYLPPIAIPGEDPLGPMEDVNVEEATHGFDMLHYQLTYTFASGMTQTLATKFNLARTSRYFVVMSLPPLTPDFFAIVVGQATRAQEASVTPVTNPRVPFQIMTMFSDSRVASALSPGADSLSDSPVDDIDTDFPSATMVDNELSTATGDAQRALLPGQQTVTPGSHTPQPDFLRHRDPLLRSDPFPLEQQQMHDPVSAGPSSASTPYSTASDLDITRTISNESAVYSDEERLVSRSRTTIHDLLNRDPPSPAIQSRSRSSGSVIPRSRKATSQGGARESDKKRRMDINSLLDHR